MLLSFIYFNSNIRIVGITVSILIPIPNVYSVVNTLHTSRCSRKPSQKPVASRGLGNTNNAAIAATTATTTNDMDTTPSPVKWMAEASKKDKSKVMDF